MMKIIIFNISIFQTKLSKGKVIWLSGAPGMGKSTSAQLLAREKGYVYYEADTFRRMVNPFIPLNIDNPSMGIARQKKLNGKPLKQGH